MLGADELFKSTQNRITREEQRELSLKGSCNWSAQLGDRDSPATLLKEVETMFRTCPICGRQYSEYPALSRVDNKTEICPDCGLDEALARFLKFEREKKKEAVK